MAQKTLRDEAKEYEPQKTKNIADLEAVSLDMKTEDREGKNRDGEPFKYKVIVVNGVEYRVPSSVLGDIRAIMSAKPTLKTVKVIKKGTGMGTEYTVIPLE
jgi:hypothetical protein